MTVSEHWTSRSHDVTQNGHGLSKVWTATWVEWETDFDNLPVVGDAWSSERLDLRCSHINARPIENDNVNCLVTATFSTVGEEDRLERPNQVSSWQENFTFTVESYSTDAYLDLTSNEPNLISDRWSDKNIGIGTKKTIASIDIKVDEPIRVEVSSHNYSTGDYVKITDIILTGNNPFFLNDNTYQIITAGDNHFYLDGTNGSNFQDFNEYTGSAGRSDNLLYTPDNMPEFTQENASLIWTIAAYGQTMYLYRVADFINSVNSSQLASYWSSKKTAVKSQQNDDTASRDDTGEWKLQGCNMRRVGPDAIRYDFMFKFKAGGWNTWEGITTDQYPISDFTQLFDGMDKTADELNQRLRGG